MKDKHKKYHINKTQQLENYNILNTIVPKYLKNYSEVIRVFFH